MVTRLLQQQVGLWEDLWGMGSCSGAGWAWWPHVQDSFFFSTESTTDWGAGTREPGAEAISIKGLPVRHPEEGGLTFELLTLDPSVPDLLHWPDLNPESIVQH